MRIRGFVALVIVASTTTTLLTLPTPAIAKNAWHQANVLTTIITADDHYSWQDSFDDDNGHIHEHHINLIAQRGITIGCNDDGSKYCPDGILTRGQMASLIARAMDLEPPADKTRAVFNDIAGNTHEDNIRAIAERGITIGCNDDGSKYCPDDPLTRGQLASFVSRALELEPPADPTQAAFTDIAGNTHEDNIRAASYAGMDSNCSPNATDPEHYCPFGDLTRGKIAQIFATGSNADRLALMDMLSGM